MKTIKVSVKAKMGKLEKMQEFSYDEPENFEEAIEMDGEAKAMKTYLNERKTNFQDKKRREMLDAMTKGVADLAKENPEVEALLREHGVIQ